MAVPVQTEERRAASALGVLAALEARVIVLGILILVVLWLARGILAPFVAAALLAYAFSPVVSAVQSRTRLPRAIVILLGYVLVLGVAALLIAIAARKIDEELSHLSTQGPDVIAGALHKLIGNSIVIAGQTLPTDDLAKGIHNALTRLVSSPSDAVQMATRVFDFALKVVLCLIITFYFLLDGRRFGQFALRFLDRPKRARALRIAGRIHVVLGRWLRGQLLLIALVSAVLYVILGPILHVRFALVIAIFSGVLEIVPFVGPVIAAAVAATVAFATRGTDVTIVVLVAYTIVRQVEDQLVMPLVIGRAVQLHPVVTIFAVLVGLSTWGVLGGLLGVPVAATLNVTLSELYPEAMRAAREDEPEPPKTESPPKRPPEAPRITSRLRRSPAPSSQARRKPNGDEPAPTQEPMRTGEDPASGQGSAG